MKAQIVMIVLMALQLLTTALLDGQPRTGKYSLSATMLGVGVSATLLWWGGFWSPLVG